MVFVILNKNYKSTNITCCDYFIDKEVLLATAILLKQKVFLKKNYQSKHEKVVIFKQLK